MARNETTSGLVDGILKTLLFSGTLASAMVMPNILQALDKPLEKAFDKLDDRARERETRRLLSYMIRQGLVKGDYEHGLEVTEKGRKRLSEFRQGSISFPTGQVWDKTWRIIFYDIPEAKKTSRDALTSMLRTNGFYQLQRSVWVYPYPCKSELEAVASHYGINKFISYIEANHIDNQKKLIEKFETKNIM